MSQPHDHNSKAAAEPSRNIFVRFQKGFERGFNRFREGYGALLEQVIARRTTFVTISSGHRGGLPVPLFLPRARLFPRDQVGDHYNAYAGAARDAHRGVRTHCHACLQQHRVSCCPVRSKTSSVIAACRSDRTTSPSFRRRRSAHRIVT